MPFPLSQSEPYPAPVWYALYTKPHAERQVADALEQRGIHSYVPTILRWRARRRQLEREPLFACYSFAQIDFHQVSMNTISWLPGLRAIVNSEGKPLPISEKIMTYIHDRVDEFNGERPGVLQSGDRVRITEGPFKDLEAVFDTHLSGYERAQVLVRVLGRLTRCELTTHWLEAV